MELERKKIQVVGFGAGGHGRVLIETLRLHPEYEIVGLLDADPALSATSVMGVPVLGNDDLIPSLRQAGIRHAFIGVGSVASTRPRRQIYDRLLLAGFVVIAVIHPHSLIAPSAQIGQGAAVLVGAIVNTNACLGDNVLINTGAIVEHDCVIEDHVHVATGARLAGGVRVGEGTHVGIGACVRQGITLGSRSVVGAGAVVVKDVPSGVIVAGVPARVLKRVPESWLI